MNLAPEGADGAPKVNAGALLSGCLKTDASAAVLSILGVKPPSGEEDEEVEEADVAAELAEELADGTPVSAWISSEGVIT